MQDEVPKENGKRGVVIERSCTDVLCLILFVIYLVGLIVLYVQLYSNSDMRIIDHPTNDLREHCGLDKYKDKPNLYYYQLDKDLQLGGSFGKLKGACVEECPTKMGDVVTGTDGQAKYFVDMPTSELKPFHRCIPTAGQNTKDQATLCAWPKCDGKPGTKVRSPLDVCGPKSEGSDTYWFLKKPDDKRTEKLWEADGISLALIKERLDIYATETAPPCDVTVSIASVTRVIVEGKSNIRAVFEKYSSMLFQTAATLKRNAPIILALGFGGAVVLSIIVIILYAMCIKVALVILVFNLFMVMFFMDYIFFRKAGWNSGHSGAKLAGFVVGTFGDKASDLGVNVTDLANHALRDEQTANMVPVYRALAVIWSILIFLLMCVLCFIQRQIRIVIALAREAAGCLNKMPSLYIFPYFGLITLGGSSYLLCRILLAVMTLNREYVIGLGEKFNIDTVKDPDSYQNIQKTLGWICVFGYLWVYFFHMALFTSVVANCVVDWYFYRLDQEAGEYDGVGSPGYFFGKETLGALWSIIKYDLGTLCFGSFLIALCTLPRLILEYIDQEMKQHGAENPVTAKILMCAKCCLWCFEKCIKFLTEYAYINNAVTGKNFCRSAHASFVLLAEYPVQTSLNHLVTSFLRLLSCVVVPGALAVASYFALQDTGDAGSGWGVSALSIVVLAFVVTRVTVGVFEITLTTLFVAAIRDKKFHGCQYAPPALRSAMGFNEDEEVELEEKS